MGEARLKDEEMIHQLEGRPHMKVAFPLGLQHILAMFTGNLAPIFIVAGIANVTMDERILMIQCAMLISGITTFIQLYPIKLGKSYQIGAGLPIVMGTAFAFVPTLATITAVYGIRAAIGGAMVGAFIEIIIGILIKPAKKFFSPIVIGAVLVTIGIKLLGIGAGYFAGGTGAADYGSWQNLLLGFVVFLIVMLLQRYAKGMLKVTAILIGLIVGFVLAACMGKVDFAAIASAGWISIPKPLYFIPEFRLDVILAFAAVYVVSGLETLGNTSGITMAAFEREATSEENSGAVLADAIGSQLACLFNCLPNTAFGQNAGLIAMTGVINKFCIAIGAAMLILASIVPKIGAIFAAIPSSVLGGAIITVFAMILINGFKMIARAGFSEGNVLMLSVTFGIGYGLMAVPEVVAKFPSVLQFIFGDAVASVCLVGICANAVFNIIGQKTSEEQAVVIEIE